MEQHDWMGRRARDIITAFEGRITGYCQYITGCDRFLVQGEQGDAGKYPEAHWFDVNRLELVEPAVKQQTDKLVLQTGSELHDNGACESPPVK